MISSLSGVAPSFHSNSSGTRAFGPSAAPVSMDLQCRQSFRSGGNQSPASLSRSIDKVLEESQYTGEINLSGRKLKEYPQTAINYDLIDTTATDLSRNRLHEVPAQVCNYHSLERLVCYHNVIRSISSNISQLQNLVYLDICRNQLSLLPTTLCQLEQLQVLLASNNRLVSLPEEICLLHQLMQLDVSSNQITQLPVQLGELSKLQTLNVSHNQLVELPLSLSLLKLLSLDVSSNRISNIPTEFRNIDTLDELQLDSNPLVSPPAHICRKGLSHVMKHLRVTAERDERKRGVLQQQQQYDYRGNTNSNNLSGPGNTASLNRRRLSAQNSSSPLITTNNRTSISNMQPEVGAAPVSGHQRLTTQLSQGTRDSGYSSTADVRQVGGSGEEGKRRGRGDKGSLTSSSSAQWKSMEFDSVNSENNPQTFRSDVFFPMNTNHQPAKESLYKSAMKRTSAVPGAAAGGGKSEGKSAAGGGKSEGMGQEKVVKVVVNDVKSPSGSRTTRSRGMPSSRSDGLIVSHTGYKDSSSNNNNSKNKASNNHHNPAKDGRIIPVVIADKESPKSVGKKEENRAKSPNNHGTTTCSLLGEGLRTRSATTRIIKITHMVDNSSDNVVGAVCTSAEESNSIASGDLSSCSPSSESAEDISLGAGAAGRQSAGSSRSGRSVHSNEPEIDEFTRELHRQKSEYEEKKRKAGLLKKSIEEEERRKESRSRQHRTDPQSSINRPSSRTDGQTVPPDDISSYSLYSRAVASPPQVSPPHNLTTPPINHDINYSASSESLRSNTSCRSTSSGSEATSPLSNDRSERVVPVHVESSDWSGGGVSSAQNIITIPVNHVSTSSRRSSDSRSNQSTPTPYNDRDLKSNHEAMVAQHWLEAQSARQKFEEERVRMRRNFMERMPMDRFFDNNSSILGSRNRGTETQTNGGSGMTSSDAYQNDTQNFTSNRIPIHYQNSEELKQSSDPAFTVRHTAQQEQAEREITDELRKTIESMLQMKLPSSPDDLSMALKDGVVLCHLVNHVRPRSVASIHVPSPAVPKLSLPKCRRNVDNFLLACRRIGVESNQLCSAAGILEERELLNLSFTIRALLQCSGLSLPKQSSV